MLVTRATGVQADSKCLKVVGDRMGFARVVRRREDGKDVRLHPTHRLLSSVHQSAVAVAASNGHRKHWLHSELILQELPQGLLGGDTDHSMREVNAAASHPFTQ